MSVMASRMCQVDAFVFHKARASAEIRARRRAEAHAQIHDGHHVTTMIDHPDHTLRRVWQHLHRQRTDDLPHVLDVQRIRHAADLEADPRLRWNMTAVVTAEGDQVAGR